MIFIDDAGVGCILGIPVVVGYRQETGEKIVFHAKNKNNFKKQSIRILELLNVSKEEPIFVCRGSYFSGFREYLKQNNFTYTSCKITDQAQDVVEDAFMEHLYNLGVPRQIILHGKEYNRLDDELTVAIIANPNLVKHIKSERKLKRRAQSIENAIFRCPNLISSLLHESTELKDVV